MANILFRCDGSPDIGFGHIVRCLALADELQSRDFHICFAMREGPLGMRMVEEKGFQVIPSNEIGNEFDYGGWFRTCVKDKKTTAIIFDARDELLRTVVREIRDSGVLIVTIDDPEDKRLEADMAFYPPVPQVKRMDWSGFTGKLYSGWEWVILRSEFAVWRKSEQNASFAQISDKTSPPKILVTMGGSDPAGLTIKSLEALNMLTADFHVMIILGPGFAHHTALRKILASASYPFTIHENVTNMVPIMAQANMAIASFGATAYELAAMGVPAIYLCLTEDHAESASVFAEAGIAISLGIHHNVSSLLIYQNLNHLFYRKDEQIEMIRQSAQKINGQGNGRITNIITSRIHHVSGDY